MNYSIVLHVDLNEAQPLNIAFDNAANYMNWLDGHPEISGAEVVLIANGPAVQLFTDTFDHTAQKERARELAARGLSIRLCSNALRKFEIDRESLWDVCTPIEAAIPEFVRLHNEGYTYIKP